MYQCSCTKSNQITRSYSKHTHALSSHLILSEVCGKSYLKGLCVKSQASQKTSPTCRSGGLQRLCTDGGDQSEG